MNIPIYRAEIKTNLYDINMLKSYGLEKVDGIFVAKGFLIGIDEEESLCSIRQPDDIELGGWICKLETLEICLDEKEGFKLWLM